MTPFEASGLPRGASSERALTPPEARCGLLLTPLDLEPESSPLADRAVKSVAAGWYEDSKLTPADAARMRDALADGVIRASLHFDCPYTAFGGDPWTGGARAWAAAAALEEVLVLEVPRGPWRDLLDGLERELAEDGRRLVRVRRS